MCPSWKTCLPRLLFQWASAVKLLTQHVGLVQCWHHHRHHIKLVFTMIYKCRWKYCSLHVKQQSFIHSYGFWQWLKYYWKYVYTDLGSYKLTICTKRKRTKNAHETNEKRTNASHERHEKRTIYKTDARYTNSVVLLFEWLLCKLMWLTSVVLYFISKLYI